MRRWFLGLILLLGVVIPFPWVARGANDFGSPQPGRYVYDRAAVLTPAEITDLERRAAAINQVGAPIVVYLRLHDASFEETVADARVLMDAWSIQSAPGARDGVVLLFNLQPNDPRHGHFAIVAGEAHVRSGVLRQHELDRIAAEMLPALREGRFAAGIAVGLDAIHRNLTVGPPPQQRNWFQRMADTLAHQNLNLIWFVATIVVLAWGAVLWMRIPRPARRSPPLTTTEPPSDLAPALAGALVRGRVIFDLMIATFFDLARRGALSLQPVPKTLPSRSLALVHRKFPDAAAEPLVHIALRDPQVVQSDYERVVWDSLKPLAGQVPVAVQALRSALWENWPRAQQAIRAELIRRGWFDPNIRRRRIAFLIPGVIGLLLGVLALAVFLLAETPSGGIGVLALLPSGLLWLVVADLLHETTSQGKEEAMRWHGFIRGVKQATRQRVATLDLDRLLPYAIALGIRKDLDVHLRAAHLLGYVPIWLEKDQSVSDNEGDLLLYEFWKTVETTLLSGSSSRTSDTSGDGGGASSGSAASGGSF
ncbi:DUF2207 domain-containing protein [Thermomicrobium sp. CFH 73360]|uniref:DUF2207 family protein n=1 Tax=Thermomicrobium sp. CFH 73360 TaxID=2951987 RepID=UPI0020775DE6|nr:DUF2207 domain-containing protein [Thermomicrobium sp. CFH 73360]MCM8747333.1 DUF2207 domain-containing protein [Thermomicrobium sp. CFH 73360]